MSYKHNNLLAIRQSYWMDQQSEKVQTEKQYFQELLSSQGIFVSPTLEDAKYVFFSLPSIIIVKGYALGFMSQVVQELIIGFIHANKADLAARKTLKIQYHL